MDNQPQNEQEFIDFDMENAEDLDNLEDWEPSIDVAPYQVCL